MEEHSSTQSIASGWVHKESNYQAQTLVDQQNGDVFSNVPQLVTCGMRSSSLHSKDGDDGNKVDDYAACLGTLAYVSYVL